MEGDRGVVLATERYGSAESWKYFGKDDSHFNILFQSVFLPQGYPESVSSDYLQYQFWDTMQAFSSSLSGTLATQASLKGVGVGNQEATVAAATITWLLRDGTGMLGRILFAWRKGSKLDSEAKKWRLFADVLNDFAMFLEILAPYFPAFFTLIVCTAGIFKSIVGVAGGATRAALTVHQARRDNMADISAKDGSQETLVNLAGLLVSLVLIPLVTDNPILTLSLFFLFTTLHLFANYKAVRSVVMETFNEARLSIVLQQYLTDSRILSPAEANQREPVFFGKNCGFADCFLYLILAQSKPLPPFISLLNVNTGAFSHLHNAYFLFSFKGHWDMVHESHKLMDKIFSPFLKGVEAAGWDLKRTLLDWDEWRVGWKTKSN
uniref:RUS family member 1 n=1 Tax=Sparus aurata TaxID=8175 RepID=A0A671YA06_SPAAU